MKKSYDKSFNLKCITCGDTDFEFNDDKTWIKCNRCGREYLGGSDELIELNQENINLELEKTKNELTEDIQKDFKEMLKKTLGGNKNINLKFD
jgi:ribosomal protein S27E